MVPTPRFGFLCNIHSHHTTVQFTVTTCSTVQFTVEFLLPAFPACVSHIWWHDCVFSHCVFFFILYSAQLQDKLESREKEQKKQRQKLVDKLKDYLKGFSDIDENSTYEGV